MEFDDFQSWFRRPRDRSSARSVSKTCSKKRLPEERKTIFFIHFWGFLASPRRGSKKCCQNGLRSPPGEAQGQSWGRGARQVMFGILGGLPGRPGEGPGGPRSLQDPPREAPGQTCAKSAVLSSFPALDPLNGCIWLGVLNFYIGQKGVLHTTVCRTMVWPVYFLYQHWPNAYKKGVRTRKTRQYSTFGPGLARERKARTGTSVRKQAASSSMHFCIGNVLVSVTATDC